MQSFAYMGISKNPRCGFGVACNSECFAFALQMLFKRYTSKKLKFLDVPI